MKILLSPAKNLTDQSTLTFKGTVPVFEKEAYQLVKDLKKIKKVGLQELMDISVDLAAQNVLRFKQWKKASLQPENALPAVEVFDGEVYRALSVSTLDSTKFDSLNNQLRILSGLYGILKPFDLIYPYRLEMGTKLPIGESKNLYDFWKKTVTASLNKELKKGELFVNLASNEYFSVIDTKALKVPVITPDFKDYKDGKLKMISFFAKKARGMMVRYIIDTNAETIEDLKGFNYEGYQFDANLSKGNHLVFTR